MNIRFFLILLKARYSLVVFTLAITVVTTAIVTDILPRQYVATTSLVLNTSDNNPFDAPSMVAKGAATYLATQLDIIRSRSVALKAVDALGWTNDRELQRDFNESTGGNGSMREWLAERLLDKLTVQPSRDSRVISISYQSTDPQVAADAANAVAQAYMEKTLELMTDPAKRNAEWFDEQLKVLRERLMSSQARLTNFQQEEGIISLDERLDTETSRLNELSTTYVQVQAEAADVRARQLGQNHPEFRRAISREQAVQRALEKQKELLLTLKQRRDQLGILAREVESDQRLYDSTLQRYYQTSLESQFNQPNTSVLNEAVPPAEPSRPVVLFNLVSAVFFGLVLGTILAILAELFDRRIRSREDITEVLETRVLATV